MNKRPHPSSRESRRGSSSSDSYTGSGTNPQSRQPSKPSSCNRPRDNRRQLPSLTESIPEYHTHLPSTSRHRSKVDQDATGPTRDFARTSTSSASNSKPSRKHQKADSDGGRSATLAIHSGPPSRYNESVNSSPGTITDSHGRYTPATSLGGSESVNGQVDPAVKNSEASSKQNRESAESDRGRNTGRSDETLPSLPSLFGSRQPPVPPPPYPMERPREERYQYPSPTTDRYIDPARSLHPSPYYSVPPNQYPRGPKHSAPPPPQVPHHYTNAQREPPEPTYPLPPLQPQYPHPGYGHPHDPHMNGHIYHPGAGMMAYNAFENIDMSDQSNRRRRGNLPKDATYLFKTWLQNHISNPYPTEEEKQWMQEQTGMSASQVSNWFINARRRILPQMSRSAQAEHSFTNGANGTTNPATTTPPSTGSIGHNSPRDQSTLDAQPDSSQNNYYSNGNNSGNVSSLDASASNSPSMLLPPPSPSYPRGP